MSTRGLAGRATAGFGRSPGRARSFVVQRARGLLPALARWRARLGGSFWSIVEYIWFPALMLATTPFFFRALGAERFGQWALLSATISFGAILSIGTGAATVRQVALRLARDDGAGVRLVVRSALGLSIAGGLVAAAVVAAVFGLGGSALLGKMAGGATLATGLTAAAIVAIEQLENVFTAALRGGERFRIIARIEMIVRTCQVVAAVGAVWAFGTLGALFTALIVTAAGRLVVKALVVTRWLDLDVARPSLALWRSVIGDARWGWLQGIGGMVFGLADRFIVGGVLGAAALAHYSVASQVAQPLHALAAAGTSVIFPKISAALARGDETRLKSLLSGALALLLIGTTLIAGTVWWFRLELLTLWLGSGPAAASAPALGMLIWAYWLLALAVLPHYVLLGMGRMRLVALANLAAGIVTVIAMAWLVRGEGIVGVASARLLYGGVLLATFLPMHRLWRSRSVQA